MSDVSYFSYYAGHGALNYFEVYGKDGSIEKKILIDAGSNCDNSGIDEAESQYEEIKDFIFDSDDGECIFCLTHPHEDHYSNILDCLFSLDDKDEREVIDEFFIGGLDSSQCRELFAWESFPKDRFLGDVKNLYPRFNISILPETYKPVELWVSNDGDVKLYLMYNRVICGNSNDLSASFVVKKGKNYVWVTGDSTGSVFNYYLRNDERALMLANILRDGEEVYITAPHHGSIHTLNECGFINNDYNREFSDEKWTTLFRDLFGIKQYRLILGACPDDKYCHPDIMAMQIFFSLCEDTEETEYGWDVFDTEIILFQFTGYFIKIGEGNWYKQSANKFVIPTARWIVSDFCYDYDCYEIIL